MPIRISVHAPAAPDVLAEIEAGLEEYNASSAPLYDVKPLHVIATDQNGELIGGAIGRTWGECCELQQIWLNPNRRRRKEGTLLMDAFEHEARSRGCTIAYLDTFSFQAPAFYAKRGYAEALRTEGFTGGAVKITMRKHLV